MKLLNSKATLILTLSAIFMVSSVYADIGLENKDKLLIDIKSVHDSKMKAEPIELPASINNADHGGGLRDEDITIELWDAYGDGWNGNVLTLHCDTHGTDVLLALQAMVTMMMALMYRIPFPYTMVPLEYRVMAVAGRAKFPG